MNIRIQKELESLTDLQLNRIIVVDIKGLTLEPHIMKDQDSGRCVANYKNDAVTVMHEPCTEHTFSNYCEDWLDCGELIDELKIGTDYIDGFGATATKGSVSSSCYDNIKRAVAITYILIKQQA